MGLFKNNTTDASEKKGLKLQVNHTHIDKDQSETFTQMVKETVKILAIGVVLTTAAALTLKLGSDYLTDQLIKP